ncbi:hypothetical protein [Allohahella sp. A8]|uniref:hypothetical protein n=1 Tax=Allohahella sp. A8 TaxID=3141461 RepID=UPI003A7F6EB8
MFATSLPRVSVLSTCLLLAACGGGGGGSKGDPSETPAPPVSGGAGGNGSPEQPAPVAGSVALNSENYLAIASLYYRDVWANGGLALGTYSTVAAAPLQFATSATEVVPCSRGGEKIRDIVRTPFEETEIHEGDTTTTKYNDCKDASGIRNGQEHLVVRSVSEDGETTFSKYGFDQDYTFSEAAEEDGRYIASVETVDGSFEKDGNDVDFLGVNNAAFSDRSAPGFSSSLLESIDPAQLTSFSGPSAKSGTYETPTVKYNALSYEYALMELDENSEVREVQFRADAISKIDPKAAYIVSSTSPVRLLTGVFTPDAEDGGESYVIATHGAFTVQFDSGALVTVSVLRPVEADRAGQAAENVRVTFDAENDGNLEDERTMKWVDFEFAYVPLLR